MIELIAAAVSGAVAGGGVVWWQAQRAIDATEIEWLTIACGLNRGCSETMDTLTALRSNCFITNEKGHRVRYSQASVERRVKAETPKEVV